MSTAVDIDNYFAGKGSAYFYYSDRDQNHNYHAFGRDYCKVFRVDVECTFVDVEYSYGSFLLAYYNSLDHFIYFNKYCSVRNIEGIPKI